MVDVLPEGKMRVGDVDAVVVVKCTGADELIGHALQDIDQLMVSGSIV